MAPGDDIPTPSSPGWYPDPWSADGRGERYFDGKRWGTSERPLARNTIVLDDARQARKRKRLAGRFTRFARPVAVIAALLGVGWLITQFRHHNSSSSEIITLPTASTVPVHSAKRPPPGTEEGPQPLGTPAAVPAGPGKFEVLQHQQDATAAPVAWDPCRPIHYVVNMANAPPDGLALVQNAIARLHTATGFRFIYDGPTTEPARKERPPYQPGRYNTSRWAPVLVAWSNEVAFPALSGYVIGVGEAIPVYTPDAAQKLVYVTGELVLDSRDIAKMPDRGVVRAVILHELGHVMGLDHTSDRTQLMFSEAQFNVRDYGKGDLRGLSVLATQACYPGV